MEHMDMTFWCGLPVLIVSWASWYSTHKKNNLFTKISNKLHQQSNTEHIKQMVVMKSPVQCAVMDCYLFTFRK
uniref:Secreted protein n=1 Tax=Anguilla anguilla TaxID=7936 RepID=A0A0E9WIT8_ANGAN